MEINADTAVILSVGAGFFVALLLSFFLGDD
jgi:hypothetical protein